MASAIISGVDTSEAAAVIKSTLAAEQLTTLVRRVSLPSGAMRPRPQGLLGFSPRTVGTMEPLCRPPCWTNEEIASIDREPMRC